LRQINEYLDTLSGSEVNTAGRRAHYAALHALRAEQLAEREKPAPGNAITAEYLTACVRRRLSPDAIVLNEGITNYTTIHAHIGAAFPQAMYASGGSALGWSGGAAIGMKLAAPERMVVSLTGDGSYMFSVPSSVHWIARRYTTPFLQIVYNNGGWRAPRFSTLGVHPDGFASREADLGISFEPAPDYSGIAAAAGGAFARIVRNADELPDALDAAIRAVTVEGRCAVLDVVLADLR
jgi:acetolactate synthase-1/2/3 large subunit